MAFNDSSDFFSSFLLPMQQEVEEAGLKMSFDKAELEEPSSLDLISSIPSSRQAQRNFIRLPEGITPISPSTVVPDKETSGQETFSKMAGEVVNPRSGVIEASVQDGDKKYIIKGVSPSEVIEPPAMKTGSPRPELPVGEYAIPPEQQDQSFWQKLGEVVRSPKFRYMLAQVGQAVAPTSPGIQMAGEFGKQLAVSDVARGYRAALERGEDPDVIRGSEILTQEQKAKLRDEAAAKKKATVTEQYMKDLGTQARAISAGTAPYEEKFAQEQILAMMKVSKDPDSWQSWGYGQMRNKTTGDIVKVPVAPKENPRAEENLSRQWYKQAISESANDPEVQKYIGKGGIIVDAEGNINIQWTDPIKGKEAFERVKTRRLKAMSDSGLIPSKWVESLTEVSVEEPKEFTSITAAEIAAMPVGKEFVVQGKTWKKRADGNIERVK